MISNDFQLNPTPRVEAAWPWSRNAMEMTRKHWNVRLLTYQKPGKHSWCREYWNWFPLSPSWWWCCFDGVGDDKKWEVKLEQDAVYIVKIDWLIYTNDKGFRGEDFLDAIRILIQATETTIWLQGHNIQIVSRHHSRFYYAIAFISDSIQFLCSQQVS